jgi:adenylylsulfate kinase
MTTNIVWHSHKVSRKEREEIKKHKPCLLWFTGLPSAGKSTIAMELEYLLNKHGAHTYVLDGDNIRHGLSNNLGFSKEDRTENIRRVGEVAKLFVDAGVIPIAAFVSPIRADRDLVRSLMKPGEFVEVYVKCSLEVCKERDPKGLYKKAIAGDVKDFTGISQPYEEPREPELVIETDRLSIEESVIKVVDYLASKDVFKPNATLASAGKDGK